MDKLTVLDLTERYNVSTTTVYAWIEKGLPHNVERRVGMKPRYVFVPSELEQWHNDNYGIKKAE